MCRGNITTMVAKPLTIVQMLPELNSGGVERGTLELGSYLTERGHRSFVISGGGRLVDPLEKEGSQHISWPVGKKSPVTLRYIIPLRRFLLNNRVDILHVRSRVPAWLAYLTLKTIPKSQRPHLVTTFHGFYSINKYSAIMTKGERVIAISQTIAKHIRKMYNVPEEKIVTIYRGVDIEAFDPANIDKSRLDVLQNKWLISDPSVPLIILPGRITRLKGHDILIHALSSLKNLQWNALFIGDPAENRRVTEELKGMISEYQLKDRIKFVGHCEDMPAAYLLADIVVSATSTTPEAFGRVAVEASAMGKSIIASGHGGSLETVLPGKTGWLVKPNDIQSMNKALEEAISAGELRQNFGRHGKEWVRNNFTVTNMCLKTLALYKEILSDNI